MPPRSQSQSDLTSETNESQVYSGQITRLRAKAITYAEVTLQSSVTTFDQGKDQLEVQDEVMVTSYSEEETIPKTPKVKFVKPSTSSTHTMVLRP